MCQIVRRPCTSGMTGLGAIHKLCHTFFDYFGPPPLPQPCHKSQPPPKKLCNGNFHTPQFIVHLISAASVKKEVGGRSQSEKDTFPFRSNSRPGVGVQIEIFSVNDLIIVLTLGRRYL